MDYLENHNDVSYFREVTHASAPIFAFKNYNAPSVFQPESMLREARRQKNLLTKPIPPVCVLDPDGDLLSRLLETGKAELCPDWACYHTKLYKFEHAGLQLGIIGCAVGAAFSVLLAEQAFASGCELLISITSAGQILPLEERAYFILIERALRDEGTSYHYLAPSRYVQADPALIGPVITALLVAGRNIHLGATWTTDAPFRETEEAIAEAMREGILAVEMEAAALYAFAQARRKKVLCFAQVTNQMGKIDGDFEKGEANGADSALNLIAIAASIAMGVGR